MDNLFPRETSMHNVAPENLSILKNKVQEEKKIVAVIPRTVLKWLLYFHTKQLYFIFNSTGVAMGSPFRTSLANIFTTSLEEDVPVTRNDASTTQMLMRNKQKSTLL